MARCRPVLTAELTGWLLDWTCNVGRPASESRPAFWPSHWQAVDGRAGSGPWASDLGEPEVAAATYSAQTRCCDSHTGGRLTVSLYRAT